MSDQPVLSLSSVSLHYESQRVLRDASCAFPGHTICAILGPSGSGKSTLLRTFCRMNDRIPGFRVAGQVRVMGRDIYNDGVDVYALRRQVGLIFQKPCVFPKSIYQNVVFGLQHHHPECKAEFPGRAEQALKKAFLWDEVKDRLGHPAPTLSQGQQQPGHCAHPGRRSRNPADGRAHLGARSQIVARHRGVDPFPQAAAHRAAGDPPGGAGPARGRLPPARGGGDVGGRQRPAPLGIPNPFPTCVARRHSVPLRPGAFNVPRFIL